MMQNNYLSGFIPTEIGNLLNLQTFNVSNNFLAGPIPSNGVLDQFGTASFLGNHGLCGKHINQLCKDDDGSSTGSQPINQLCKDDDGSSTGSQPTGSQNVKKNSGRHCFLLHLCVSRVVFFTKKLGKNDAKGLAVDVGGGASIVMFHGDLPYPSKDIIKKLETLNE
uniref:Uncharacterized protein n=1 Tax=Lactuca sativa TaxID=4236 RepID=A0A9R1VAB4_LACSA|nr:hypothetical protein LSAT_V11C500260310 [Lactuca sativa]